MPYFVVTIAPIDPICFIMFWIIPEDRAIWGEKFRNAGTSERYDDYRE